MLPLLLVLVGLCLVTPAASAAPSSAPAALVRYTGDASSATGNALGQGACDVNGDGRSDLVVGAWFWDKTPVNNIGAAYVIFGADKLTSNQLADPAAAGAVRIDGPNTASALVGFAVGCAGDMNDDGFDDIAISHYTAQRAYVLFGRTNFTSVALDSIGDRGFVVKGNSSSGNVGFSFAGVGDVNSDGKDDLAVAEVAASTQGRTRNGRVWIVAGRDDISDVDLTAPTTGQVLFSVDGAISEERLGTVAEAGDVNGDGVADLVLGAYTSTPWGASIAVPGAAYVVFGGSTGTIDSANLGTQGFAIFGPKRARDRLGISVSAAGDVNDDGKADLLIGADGVFNAATGNRNGGAAVVFGAADSTTVYTDPTAGQGQSVFTCPTGETPGSCVTPGRRGYWINGAAANDSAGYSAAGLGDVNGDDVPDLAIGAYGFDPQDPANAGATLSGAGATYVVYGAPGAVTQNLAGLAAADGYRLDGTKAGDRFGRQVAGVGDLDGNGQDDLAVGADFASRPGTQNGEVTIALLGKLKAAVALTAPRTATPGDSIALSATVTSPMGTDLDQGTVTFTFAGSALPGCADRPVVNGTATCDTTIAFSGSNQVVATFSGTSTVQKVDSAPSTLTSSRVGGADGNARVTGGAVYGQQLGLAGTVAGSGAGGSVTVSENGRNLGSGDVTDGSFALKLPVGVLGSGRHVLTIAYGGDARNAASTTTLTVDIGSKAPVVKTSQDRRKLTVTIRAFGADPTGQFVITERGRTRASGQIDASGKSVFRLPRLLKSGDSFTVTYRSALDATASTRSKVASK